MTSSLEQLCVNAIRTLSMDAVQKANSGHPGMPMGMADAAFVLWTKFLRHNPKNPNWLNRDRFILSAGHGSMLLYSLLHLTGYEVSINDIKQFRQWGSITPGHPEYGMTPGVETTTGPLGQGFANGVGMAMAEAHYAERFNQPDHLIVDHYVYGIVSDGDLMEGISHEAASLAGHLKLGKLIYLYDDNQISIDGSTDITFTEDVLKRFEAYGWHVNRVDGHDREAIEVALKEAQSETDRPSLIACKTKIGYGSPSKEGTSASHGSPLGEEEIARTKAAYGWNYPKFEIPTEVKAVFEQAIEKGKASESEWKQSLVIYSESYSKQAKEFRKYFENRFIDELTEKYPVFEADEKGMATRKASGKVINTIAPFSPNLIGGSADLAASNNTTIDGEGFMAPEFMDKRNIHFGVREHAMGAIANGMCMYGGIKPYVASFLIFTDYCKPAIRIAALSHVDPIYVMTHDSIGLGEDGPTHQPIEQLMSLRATPNVTVVRPADANEVSMAWKIAMENSSGPTVLALTRQNLPVYERNDTNAATLTQKGAYILWESSETPEVLLLATGSEVEIAFNAGKKLQKEGIHARVVSMPSWELFEKQSDAYKESVLPSTIEARISIEAGSTLGWHKYVGSKGVAIGLDHFGASAPYQTLYREFGLTEEVVITHAKKLMGS